MPDHTIRFCTDKNVDSLIGFIRTHWKKDHVFVHNRKLFDFQHRIDESNYSFVCAWQGDEIVACLGFTAIEQYMPAEKKQVAEGKHPFHGKGIWLCLWKSREDVAAGMGFYLYRFLEEALEPEWVSAIGYSPYSEKVFKMLHWERTLMRHFFRLNTKISPENLTLIKAEQPNTAPSISSGSSCTIRKIGWDELQALDTGQTMPKKNPDYLLGRYANHPVFKYELLALERGAKIVLYLIARVVEVPEGKCLRIIDAYGDISKSISLENPDTCFEFFPGIQYVDFLCEGINPKLIHGLGLREKTAEETVPEYFSPFSPENVIVKAAVNRPTEGFYYCKGDADQDRPN